MNLQTQRVTVQGPCGAIEALRDDPSGPAKGVAVISHPHPLFGGTMDNKVVQTLARAFVHSGWSAVRYNFRGVGASAGQYDDGRGEVDDLLAVVSQQAGQGALALAGFSFGAFVTAQAVSQLTGQRTVEQLVLVGTAASRFAVPTVPHDLHERTLVVHGELDDTVPLSAVMAWARPQTLPVLVVPGGGHFFHGQLPLLKSRVMRHLGV
jgi:alpha/beta superfamily hydrolase